MKRRLLNVLTALSLLLCVAVCVLWVRSYSHFDRLGFGGSGLCVVASYNGTLSVWTLSQPCILFQEGFETAEKGSDEWPARWADSWDSLMPFGVSQSHRRLAGFGWVSGEFFPPGWGMVREADDSAPRYGALGCPLWAVGAIVLVLPISRAAASLRTALRRRRTMAKGTCFRCGYDLRATPGQCPECGCRSAVVG